MPVVIRKIGFPEVISRGIVVDEEETFHQKKTKSLLFYMIEDERNDMYVTLVGGDFKESGKDRNIEVKVSLVNYSGDVYPDVKKLHSRFFQCLIFLN